MFYRRSLEKLSLVIALLFVAATHPAAASGQAEIKTPDRDELVYIFEPTAQGENARFRVDLYFRGDKSGTTRLRLPLEWDGQERLYNQIKDLRAASENARIAETGGRHSLDDVMPDLLKAARKKGTVLSAETVEAAVRRYVKGGVREDIRRHIEEGALIRPREDVLGACLEMYSAEAADKKTALPQFRFKAETVGKDRRGCRSWFDALPRNSRV